MLRSVRDIATKANESEEKKNTYRKRSVDNCPNDNGGNGAHVVGYGTNAAVRTTVTARARERAMRRISRANVNVNTNSTKLWQALSAIG